MLLSISAYLSISSAICDAITRSKGQVMVWYGVVGLNVPLDDFTVRWPKQQCHSTEGQSSVNQVKGQSHHAQLTKM